MKKSKVVHAGLLSAAAGLIGCGRDTPRNVHLDQSGNCIDESSRSFVDQRVCYGYGGGYYGGQHYIYVPGNSAPYYRSYGSPGYVRPWGSGASSNSSGTSRGVFGGTAAGEGGGAGE